MAIIFCERRASCSLNNEDPKISALLSILVHFNWFMWLIYVPAASFSTQSIIKSFRFALIVQLTQVLGLIVKKLVLQFCLPMYNSQWVFCKQLIGCDTSISQHWPRVKRTKNGHRKVYPHSNNQKTTKYRRGGGDWWEGWLSKALVVDNYLLPILEVGTLFNYALYPMSGCRNSKRSNSISNVCFLSGILCMVSELVVRPYIRTMV